jgi:hypothetical protein
MLVETTVFHWVWQMADLKGPQMVVLWAVSMDNQRAVHSAHLMAGSLAVN